MMIEQHETSSPLTVPEFRPELVGFRAEEFLTLTETLLAVPIEQDQARLDAAPFRLSAPEPLPEPPLPILPPRWYPRPSTGVIEAARASLVPPPRPARLDGRAAELDRVLKPLLSGHPVSVQGEAGVGKTTLLAMVATHERTRQRFRRIWWIDQPARLEQTLALALNLPHVLADANPIARRSRLAGQLDDHTLLIIDNAIDGEFDLTSLHGLTAHVLVAFETEPEVLDPDEPLPEDPEGVVTLRVLDDTAAIDALAYYAGIEDTRRIRGELMQIANALGNYPYALRLAGHLIRHDGLSLDDLAEAITLDGTPAPDPDAGEGEAAITLNRALDVTVSALPRDYRILYEAFGAFPASGAPFEGLHAVAKIGSPLAARRGLIFLADYGLIQADHRDPQHYTMHPAAYARVSGSEKHAPNNQLGKLMRAWALRYARAQAGDVLALYRAEPSLLHAHMMALAAGMPDKSDALLDALRPYLREYVPEALEGEPDDAPFELGGPRGEASGLIAQGIALTDTGAYEAAEQVLVQALALRRTHDSPHAVAEALVALARVHDQTGRYSQAAEALVEAAELIYKLGAEPSLSVVRRGLARVYRHMGHLQDALDVLDDAPEARLEYAAILRAQGHYAAAVEEMAQAENATPYARAELFLLAGRYAEALEAIAGEDDPASAHLRAQVYHLQGALDEAIQGYHRALDCCGDDIPARAKALRGLGAALASAGQFDDARAALEAALELERAQPSPDPVRVGRALRLLAAVYLVAGEDERAVELARDALDQLDGERSPGDAADACRTLGRVLWRQGDYAGALEAFQGEIEFAQSMADRDDARIGMALHHFADAARMTGSLDRAVANYRRALTHKNPATDPGGYWITQLALHRALTEMGRQGNALDITQEMLDHLTARGQPDLAAYGYAQAIRARTQQAMDRPIRAGQSIQEWTRLLAARSAEAVEGPHPGLPTLALGLAVRSLLADNRPALALPLAERSAALTAAAYPDALPAWAAARDLGEVYMALDRLEEAVITLEPLLGDDLRAQPGTFAQAHRLSGDAYRRAGDLETALAHYEQAADVEPDALLKGLTRRAAGEVLLDLGRPGAAVESFGLALELIERAEHPDVAAQLLTLQAQTLGGLNRYAEAIDVYEDALTVLRAVEGVSPEHTADVLHALGQTHEAQGQLPEAARVYRRALNVLERADAPRQIRDILHALARVAAALGEGTAVQLYEQTRDQTREWGDQRELGRVLCELGDVHRDAGRMLPAIQNYQAALEAQAADDLLSDRVNTLRNLGRAYAQMERYDEAREAWTEALDLSKDMPDLSPLETALTYHAIAEAHRSQRNYQKAEIAFREALKHHSPNSVPAAATWRALGQVLHETQRHPEAVETLRRAIEIEKAQPQQANARLVLTLQLLAEAQEARGDLDAAIARHHEALVYMDRRLQPVGYADSLRTLGRLYREHGAHQQAITALNEALEIESGHAPRSDERISETLQAIADTYRDQGELEKAAEYYQKVTVYANMSRRASTELRATLDELERRRATLQAAQQSLALLDRNDEADLKDLAFIYALIARSYANLSQPQECATTIHAMLDALDEHRADLDRDHTETDMRALAWLSIIHQAQDDDDIPAARAACAEALLSVSNANLRWVIEQLARSFEAE